VEESEKVILKLLSEAEQILDDVELINTLQNAKIMATQIDEKIKESTEIERQVEAIRDSYKPVATRGSVLFFVIKDLALVDPMYQYSLQYVSRLVANALAAAPSSQEQATRMRSLIESITSMLFLNISRGLFAAHKLTFSFLIATAIALQSGQLDQPRWSVLLRGAGVADKA